VEVLDKENLSRHIFTNHSCNFGYRDSFFKREGKNRFVILSVVFQLRKVPELNLTYGAIHEVLKQNKIEEPTIKDVSDAVISIRQSKLPDPKVIANCGSFFKNPEVSTEKHESLVADFPNLVAYPTPNGYKLAAGWLIEACGWKGKRIGDVGTHPKQALVIVNYGNAKAEDLIDFSAQIQAVVFEKFGVQLEPEVNFI
jgi:UDP-N-acetylmuramate dehydrogenase